MARLAEPPARAVPLSQPARGSAEGRRAAAYVHRYLSLQILDEGDLGALLGPF